MRPGGGGGRPAPRPARPKGPSTFIPKTPDNRHDEKAMRKAAAFRLSKVLRVHGKELWKCGIPELNDRLAEVDRKLDEARPRSPERQDLAKARRLLVKMLRLTPKAA